MSTPKQDTINKWVNLEAVTEYADKLRRWGKSEELWGDPDIASGLEQAATQMIEAARLAHEATRAATDAAYDRLYRKGVADSPQV